MVNFNHVCAHKARRFRLPTLEGLAHSLRNICADPWACKLDLKNCYWSVHLPPSLVNCIRVAAGTNRYAIVRVPFGWHQAPGLVQHLIDRVLSSLPPTAVLVIQYLDDILVVGPRLDVQDMARRAAAALEQAGYIISPKSELEPTKLITWMGKRVNLNSACIAPSTPFVADVVSKWLLLALKRTTTNRCGGSSVRLCGLSGLRLLWVLSWVVPGNGLIRDHFGLPAPHLLLSAPFWRPLLPLSGAGSPTLFLLHPLSAFFRMRPLMPISEAAMWLASGHPGALQSDVSQFGSIAALGLVRWSPQPRV